MSTRRLAAMVLVVAVATAGTLVTGQAPAPARNAATSTQTTTSGVSAERLARLDAMLQSYVDQGRLPGVVALVLRDGRPVYQKAVGWADKEAKRPMRMDTLFRIASQSKGHHERRGADACRGRQLSLADQVGAYIPSFAKTMVAVQREVR